MPPKPSAWSHAEVVLALDLYRRRDIPGKTDPELLEVARLTGRRPAAVVFKLANLLAVETKGKKGFKHTAPMDSKVWEEFSSDSDLLTKEADRIRTQLYERSPASVEQQIQADEEGILSGAFEGSEERFSLVRRRLRAAALRRVVLRNYKIKCAMCDLDIPELLEVAHISRWGEGVKNRYNLSNTICMCSLHHKAFDLGLLTINDELAIEVSEKLNKSRAVAATNLKELKGTKLRFPEMFVPSLELLATHRRRFSS